MIDKLYIMGYSVSNNGKLLVADANKEIAPYLLEDAQRNKIVNGIFDVILNPKNQINLMSPISTDRVKAIAANSEMGRAAKYMNGYDPSSKYRMQIENATGKTVIGNVATGIKSFFALSNVFNARFEEIYNLIRNKNYDAAGELLTHYTFNHNGKLITLANVNVEMFKPLIQDLGDKQFDPNIPEDIKNILNQIILFEDSLEDQSMLLGELLNASTDRS